MIDNVKRPLWIVLIVAAALLGSWIFACAMPFAALGALAALHLRPKDAFALVFLSWVSNQAIGYLILHYPQTWDSYGWGVAIGAGAFAGAAVALLTEKALRAAHLAVRAIAAFLAALAVYELTLFAATAVLPSSAEAFGFAVVSFIFSVNAGAFVLLLGLYWLGRRIGLAPERAPALAAAA